MTITAGVIGVQGDVSEHADAITAVGQEHGHEIHVEAIRQAGSVPACDLLALPGGESTTISRLIHREGIAEEITAHVRGGKPLLATCAGLIVAARDVPDDRVDSLDLIDVGIQRNAFGRQRDSFETALTIAGLEHPFPAVFIRAPVVTDVGAGVEVLADVEDSVVAVRDPPVLGTAFHPELTDDSAVHSLAFGDYLASV